MIYYVVEFEALHCEAEVYVNGVPVVRAYSQQTYHGRPVNHLLIPGTNSLALAACLGPGPSTAWTPREPYTITVPRTRTYAKLWRIAPGGFPRDPGSELVCELEWSPELGATVTPVLTRIVTFDLSATLPAPQWSQCEELPEDFAAQATALLRGLHGSLAAHDPEPFIRLSQPRFEDCARAFEIDLLEDQVGFRQQFAEFPDAVFEPFDEATLDFRRVAGDRLVDCQDRSWRSPLRTKPDAKGAIALSYRVQLGRLNGGWRIVL